MHDDQNPPEAGLPEPAPETGARPAAEPVTAGFVFTGTTDEYFRIWIVNMCLSLVTLGIYSAWAKVRLTQYIRAHTTLDGMPFTYDANPMAILRGRIVAVIVFGGWTALGYVAPLAQLALLLPLAFVVPWLIVASLRFNARVTTYRNVGFTFDGRYGDALGYFVVAPVLSVFTLYLLIPWVVCRQRVWQAVHTSWGDRRWRCAAPVPTSTWRTCPSSSRSSWRSSCSRSPSACRRSARKANHPSRPALRRPCTRSYWFT
jgi:uncharacterized membrane protein YjgN (DUF898 family)